VVIRLHIPLFTSTVPLETLMNIWIMITVAVLAVICAALFVVKLIRG
jgi:hypothetical protein